MTQRFGGERFGLPVSGLIVVLMAHSHSGSQFLPHLPLHWKAIMFPPHCGQTRLMIEEIMLAFISPGIVSISLMADSSLAPKVSSPKALALTKLRGAAGDRV